MISRACSAWIWPKAPGLKRDAARAQATIAGGQAGRGTVTETDCRGEKGQESGGTGQSVKEKSQIQGGRSKISYLIMGRYRFTAALAS